MRYTPFLLLLALGLTALTLCGCPDKEDGDTTVVVRDDNAGGGGSDTIVDRRDDPAPAPAGDTNIDISVETHDDNWNKPVTSKWPEVQVVVDEQVQAWNARVISAYRSTFADDSPVRDNLVTVFETDAGGATAHLYRLDDFAVVNQTDTEAQAKVVILRRDPTSPGAPDTRIERTYTLRKNPAGLWLVYDVVDVATTEVPRTTVVVDGVPATP